MPSFKPPAINSFVVLKLIEFIGIFYFKYYIEKVFILLYFNMQEGLIVDLLYMTE